MTQRRQRGMHLVEPDSPHILSVAVAGEQVAHLGMPAVHRLNAARGAENKVSIRHVDRFVIGVSEPRSDLAHLPGFQVHFVKVVVVGLVRFLPGEREPLRVVRNVRVADHAAGIVNQRGELTVNSVHLQYAQGRARYEVMFVLRVGEPLGVGIVRTAHVEVLGERDALELVGVWRQAQFAAFFARRRIQQCPSRISRRNAGQRLALAAEFSGIFAQRVDHALNCFDVGGARHSVLGAPVGDEFFAVVRFHVFIFRRQAEFEATALPGATGGVRRADALVLHHGRGERLHVNRRSGRQARSQTTYKHHNTNGKSHAYLLHELTVYFPAGLPHASTSVRAAYPPGLLSISLVNFIHFTVRFPIGNPWRSP